MKECVKVLVVDDLKENHLVMESVLSDPNMEIVSAMSGEESLSLCLEHDFAVIFMDVQMPGMDGFEVAELLRSIDKTKNIPIIFVTAINNEQKSIFKGYEVGAVDYLSKPIDPIILRSKAQIFRELYLQRLTIERQMKQLKEQMNELVKAKQENEKMESLSLQDGLTKAYNRRGLDKFMSIHWNSCLRYRLPCSAIMIDIDDFKKYNDHYGHLKGDQVLIEVVNAISGSLYRPEDLVGRYGGEEFMVVMPNSDIEGAVIVAKRIQEAIDKLAIPHEFSSCKNQVTVSMGVAGMVPVPTMNFENLIEEADRKMYEVKENGRNNIKY